MARGGKRNGAGRKAGTANLKTREIADRAAAEGITPLEVMLTSMRKLYAAEEFTAACAIAKDAAPYVHARLATMELSGKGGEAIQIKIVDDWARDLAPK